MKSRPSKLDDVAEHLDKWFGEEKASLAIAQQRLVSEYDIQVSLGRLSSWWADRQQRLVQEQLLERVASGARFVRDLEDRFSKDAPPELSTLVNLLKLLVMQLSVHGAADPKTLSIVSGLMKPVMDFAKLQQAQQELELSRARFQRDTCDTFLRWVADERAREISTSNDDHRSKIAQLHELMFNEPLKQE